MLQRALRHRPFLLLWLGQTVSRFGDSLHRFALVWWVLQTTGSGLAMGTVVICQTVPTIIFVLVGGATVDRFHRIRIMLFSDVARAMLTAAITALAMSKHLEMWHLYIVSSLFGLVDAFFQPAYSAVVPALTPAEDLVSANALTVVSGQVTSIAGPTLGALLVALGGSGIAFAVDATTFVVSAICILPMGNVRMDAPKSHYVPDEDEDFTGFSRPSVGSTVTIASTITHIGQLGSFIAVPTPEPTETRIQYWREIREGFAVIKAEPWLWISIGCSSVFNSTDYAVFSVTLPYLILNVMSLHQNALGIVQSIYAVGTVLAAVWLGRRTKLRSRGAIFYGTYIGAGACTVLFGLPITIYGIGAVCFVRGVLLAAGGLSYTGSLQDLVPGDTLGRVSSIDWLGSSLLMPVGFAVVGWATDHVSPSWVFISVGAAGIALPALALVHPRIRSFD